jgi:hypothetical protein
MYNHNLQIHIIHHVIKEMVQKRIMSVEDNIEQLLWKLEPSA